MIKKYQDLGKRLSNDEMKHIKGGIVWPALRSFTCEVSPNNFQPGGCTDWSTFGDNCCTNRYGIPLVATWGDYGCTVQACGEI